MHLSDLKQKLPIEVIEILQNEGIDELRPSQEKAIEAGLFENKNLLICTPTASGKTLIGEMIAAKKIVERFGKTVYIVPLKALANEKYKEFKKKYANLFKVALATGDPDNEDTYISNYDLIVCTAEKLDSLIRHHAPWLKEVAVVVVDEIHLLNDPSRGPTLEILITILKQMLKNVQILGLSATIGNPEELAAWLEASLVLDDWRPVELKKGIYFDGQIKFHQDKG